MGFSVDNRITIFKQYAKSQLLLTSSYMKMFMKFCMRNLPFNLRYRLLSLRKCILETNFNKFVYQFPHLVSSSYKYLITVLGYAIRLCKNLVIKYNYKLFMLSLIVICIVFAWDMQNSPYHVYNTSNMLDLEVLEKPKVPKCKARLVAYNDTISDILMDNGVSWNEIYAILSDKNSKNIFTNLNVGQKLEFCFDHKRNLSTINYYLDDLETFTVEKRQNNFKSYKQSKKYSYERAFAHGVITDSLFAAGKKANMSDTLIMNMADIFAWDIDFSLDLRSGDSFKILYEKKLLDGQVVGEGKILLAQFINRSKTYRAVFFNANKNSGSYYDFAGNSMRKKFLRSPVNFTRISSHFNLKRLHPKLHIIRAHKGVDYAAPTGTKIKAVGNGKVIFKGIKGGYGKVIILQHGSKYSTLYAHLHKFAKSIYEGKKVTQGELIGYVGSTGLATGPHLHYEFRVNGKHKNPVTVKLPDSAPLSKKFMPRFRANNAILLKQFDLLDNAE